MASFEKKIIAFLLVPCYIHHDFIGWKFLCWMSEFHFGAVKFSGSGILTTALTCRILKYDIWWLWRSGMIFWSQIRFDDYFLLLHNPQSDNYWKLIDSYSHIFQLTKELISGNTFVGWKEGLINFPPTYKYERNSTRYVGELHNEAEKKRSPAWLSLFLIILYFWLRLEIYQVCIYPQFHIYQVKACKPWPCFRTWDFF